MNYSSLVHREWNFKYHIVFVLQYRRQIIYGKIKSETREDKIVDQIRRIYRLIYGRTSKGW